MRCKFLLYKLGTIGSLHAITWPEYDFLGGEVEPPAIAGKHKFRSAYRLWLSRDRSWELINPRVALRFVAVARCPTWGHTNYISRPCQTGVNLWEGFWSPANNNGRTVLVGHVIGKDPFFSSAQKSCQTRVTVLLSFLSLFHFFSLPSHPLKKKSCGKVQTRNRWKSRRSRH